MNKKALFTGALALLVLFAVLSAANAVVLDPSGCPYSVNPLLDFSVISENNHPCSPFISRTE